VGGGEAPLAIGFPREGGVLWPDLVTRQAAKGEGLFRDFELGKFQKNVEQGAVDGALILGSVERDLVEGAIVATTSGAVMAWFWGAGRGGLFHTSRLWAGARGRARERGVGAEGIIRR
jgi:hypothetical protein